MQQRRLWVTYALWAVGGPLGLHHLYLRRDSHALLWMLTFGGFGVGWLREFFRLPAYVKKTNGKRRPSGMPVPPISPVRFLGQVCMGIYFGMVALICLSSLNYFYLLVLPLAVSMGIHLVSSVGEETSDLHKTLMASLVTSTVFYGRPLGTFPASLVASLTATQNRRYKGGETLEEPLGVRLYRLSLAWLAFSAPLAYCVVYNTTATISYVAESIAALLDWLWFFPSLRVLLESVLLLPYRAFCLVTGGGRLILEDWERVLERFVSIHNERREAAMQVLGVSHGATFEVISHNYRELVKMWHPDHNPHNKEEATRQFMEIQEAYETLVRLNKLQQH
ncbi:dnaJ homolog subfamily C member 22 [Erpetoichthys calabaricus]|uniref:DnaJ homolog subfamily C member 22 n=1 Tax=Erpetoichthys calabaricus TaxID=27687 RepID=A0A8C4SZJ6_ERPCA|nr:dnaJ homolog subfamily C member 22 [Erpetoichthys calabaricus]